MQRHNDDRTEEERRTHTVLYGGVDTFMSSWGPPAALGVDSRAYWACRPEDCDRVRAWVAAREEFPRVHELSTPPHGRDFVHVYVVRLDHPALEGGA